MNSVIFPQLLKSLISGLLCCFWEDALWLLRRWLMCLFACCSLEKCLSCVSFCFGWSFSQSWLCRACQSWWKGRQAAGGKGLSPSLLSWMQSLPHLAQYSSCFTHQRPHPCLLMGEIQGKQPGWVEASFPYVCFLGELFDSLSDRSLPAGHWEGSLVMGQWPHMWVGKPCFHHRFTKLLLKSRMWHFWFGSDGVKSALGEGNSLEGSWSAVQPGLLATNKGLCIANLEQCCIRRSSLRWSLCERGRTATQRTASRWTGSCSNRMSSKVLLPLTCVFWMSVG